MNNDSKLIVIASLTGSDKENILEQTKELQPPVPTKGSPAYATFLNDFINSPANVTSTICEFLKEKSHWEVDSETNFQTYINTFDGAPFIASYGSGTMNVSDTFYSIDATINELMVVAKIPPLKTQEIINKEDLKSWLTGDFQNTPKEIVFLIQNLSGSDNQLQLQFVTATLKIEYTPEKHGIHLGPKGPSYKITGSQIVANAQLMDSSYFKSNGAQYLSLGFTNVTDWIEANTSSVVLEEELV